MLSSRLVLPDRGVELRLRLATEVAATQTRSLCPEGHLRPAQAEISNSCRAITNNLHGSARRLPIFDLQTFHPAKFTGIVSYQDEIVGEGIRYKCWCPAGISFQRFPRFVLALRLAHQLTSPSARDPLKETRRPTRHRSVSRGLRQWLDDHNHFQIHLRHTDWHLKL